MQIPVNSNDLTYFNVTATVDIFNRQMIFDTSSTEFTNSPSGSGCSIAIGVRDQSGVWVTGVDWDNDFNDVFDNPQIPDCSVQSEYDLSLYGHYAFLFQQYRIYAAIKDSNDNIFRLQFPVKSVCKPDAFTDNGYVYGLFDVTIDCTNQLLTITELTNITYNKLQPDTTVKSGTLYYPRGTVSDLDFSATPFTDNRVYTGTYTVNNTTTATYDLGDGFYVQVLYVTDNVDFPARCGTMMAQVMCCINEQYKKWKKNCDNAIGKQSEELLWKATFPLLEGITREQRGLDASVQVAEIQKILDCDCNCNGVQKVEAAPVNPLVYNIVIEGGGDVVIDPVVIGNTKTYTVISKLYSIGKKNPLDLAWSITADLSVSNTVTYKIEFDYKKAAEYILNNIENDNTLLTQFNSLVWASGATDLSNLNGRCVIDISSVNYFLTYRVPSAAVTVLNIIIGSTTYDAPSGLIASNISGIEAWLNGLSLGTFEVNYASSNGGLYSSILTNNNSNSPVSVTYATTSGNVTIAFSKTNKSLIAFLQALVDYLCEITSLQVYLGQTLSLCSFDYNDDIITTNYSETDTLGEYQAAQASVICDLVSRISDLTSVTCTKLKALFIDRVTSSFTGAGRLFGVDADTNCTGFTNSQIALGIISAINTDSTVKAEFCAIDCTTPAECPEVSNTNVAAINSTVIGVYGVTWSQTPSSSQTVTVKYKVNGSLTWITAINNLLLFPNGNISGSSPYTINGLLSGTTYDVLVINNCGGVGFQKQITTPANTVYSGDFLLDNVIYDICGDTPITLYSSAPFSTGVTMYTDAGLTTVVTGYVYIAENNTGDIYEIDNTTGVVGDPTGNSCASGTPGVYILGNDTGTICGGTQLTYYTNGAFAIGKILYTDSGLTSPVSGYIYVVVTSTNHIYNLNTSTGVIGSDTGLLCTGTATLTLSFLNAGGSFLSFVGTLNRAVDGNIVINQVFADGFSISDCSTPAVASAQRNTNISLNAGNVNTSGTPSSTTGVWASAIKYTLYNVSINGSSVSNNDVIVVGSYNVTVIIPSCV